MVLRVLFFINNAMVTSSHLLVTGTSAHQCSWQSNPKEAWQQGGSRGVGCLLILQNADDNTSSKGASKGPLRKDSTWNPAKRREVPRTSYFFSGITARHLLDILHLKFCVQEALWSSPRSVLLPRHPGSPLSWPLHRRLLGNTHRFLQTSHFLFYLRQTRRPCPDQSPLDDAFKSSRAGFSNFPLPIKSPHLCWRH